jgi:geranylgeranyl reductase family protein
MGKFDIIVVGAGTGGSTAARKAVENGYTVGLIDQKPQEKIGDKVCGEAVGKHHFDHLKISTPKGDELASLIRGIDIYSPDQKTLFRVESEGLHGFMVNRHKLGQRLLNEALDQGVELLANTTVLSPIMKQDFVHGVKAKNRLRNEIQHHYGKVIIDASGMTAVIRKQTPIKWGFERKILNEDVEICYQEIREITNTSELNYLGIYLNQTVSPGGYYWIFPKGGNIVNVGLGLQMKTPFPNPKTQFYNHILKTPLFKNSKKITGKGGLLATRRPINSLVGNGILVIGDAACQPNPIHGGGIGPSMIAGHLAAELACEAIEKGDASRRGMWRYNQEYMASYGAKAAGLDVFRLFLQKCSNSDLNYGMSNRLIQEEDILRASLGEDLRLNITEKARRVFRGIRRLSFLRALQTTADKMKQIKELYTQFPEPEDHSTWIANVDSLIDEMKRTVSV